MPAHEPDIGRIQGMGGVDMFQQGLDLEVDSDCLEVVAGRRAAYPPAI